MAISLQYGPGVGAYASPMTAASKQQARYEFVTPYALQASDQRFQSGEAERQRGWQSGEAALGRTFEEQMAAAQRGWQSGESELDRALTKGESGAQRRFSESQSSLQREFESAEAEKARKAQEELAAYQARVNFWTQNPNYGKKYGPTNIVAALNYGWPNNVNLPF